MHLDLARIAGAVRAVGAAGIVHCPGVLSASTSQEWAAELAAGPFARVEQAGSVRERYETYSLTGGFVAYPLTAALAAELRGIVAGLPATAGWAPNEAVVQQYRGDDAGIGPHRDFSRNVALIAIFTVSGKTVLEHLGPPPNYSIINSWTVTPGDLVLIRADGYGGRRLSRPYHRVLAPSDGGRLAATFRHNDTSSMGVDKQNSSPS